jgi:hypothetical protein
VADCPNKEKSSKDKNIKSKKDKEGKTMTFKEKKKGHAFIVSSGTLIHRVIVKIKGNPSHLLASLSIGSLLSSTLSHVPHHASWISVQRYNTMRAVVGVRVRMRSPLRRNLLGYGKRLIIS